MEVRQNEVQAEEQAPQREDSSYVPPPVSSTHALFEELTRPTSADADADPYAMPDEGDPAHPLLSESLVGVSGAIFGGAIGSLSGETGAIAGAIIGAVVGWIAGRN
ncbi:MAG: hypothetical protein ACREOJ_07635 [Gemmatimonadaceae bacterium]